MQKITLNWYNISDRAYYDSDLQKWVVYARTKKQIEKLKKITHIFDNKLIWTITKKRKYINSKGFIKYHLTTD